MARSKGREEGAFHICGVLFREASVRVADGMMRPEIKMTASQRSRNYAFAIFLRNDMVTCS